MSPAAGLRSGPCDADQLGAGGMPGPPDWGRSDPSRSLVDIETKSTHKTNEEGDTS